MSKPLEFWFDFSSPYGYLASRKIDALAAKYDRNVDWKPMLLGVAFKRVGTAPLTSLPLKGDYSKRDLARTARFHGIDDFRMPATFPIATQAPARIVVWLRERDAALAKRVAKRLYRGYFFDGIDISNPDRAAEIAAAEGVERTAARAAIDDPTVKEAFKRDVDEALERGVFGSPFVFVDGEPFWGFDRFDQIERWLASGGF